MNKKNILILLMLVLILFFQTTSVYGNYELNKRLESCTPTRDFAADGSTSYRISGLSGSVCVFRIINNGLINKNDLICKVPYAEMQDFASNNPIAIQRIKNKYCTITLNKANMSNKTEKSNNIIIYH